MILCLIILIKENQMNNIYLKLITATLCLTSIIAVADTTGSEHFYQPNSEQSTIELNYSTANQTGSISGTGFSLPMTLINFSYQYGLDEDNSLGISNFTGSATLNYGATTQKTSGMSDWNINYRGKSEQMYYGLSAVLFSSANKAATSTTDGNFNQGGMSFSPYIGYKSVKGFGIKLSLTNYQTRTIENPPYQNSEKTGGDLTSVEVFMENAYSKGLYDLYLGYSTQADASTKQYGSGGSISTVNTTGGKTTAVGYKGNYDVNTSASLLWNISYVSQTYNSSAITVNPTFNIGLGGRFLF